MKAYICNQCGRHDPPIKGYDLPPTGWYSVRHDFEPEEHLCSSACMATYAGQHLDVQRRRPEILPEPLRLTLAEEPTQEPTHA